MKKLLFLLLLFAPLARAQVYDTVATTSTPNAGRIIWNNNFKKIPAHIGYRLYDSTGLASGKVMGYDGTKWVPTEAVGNVDTLWFLSAIDSAFITNYAADAFSDQIILATNKAYFTVEVKGMLKADYTDRWVVTDTLFIMDANDSSFVTNYAADPTTDEMILGSPKANFTVTVKGDLGGSTLTATTLSTSPRVEATDSLKVGAGTALQFLGLYSATLSASDDSVDVTVSGMTTNGQALAVFGSGGVFSPIVICRSGKVTIKSAGDELVAVPVNLFVLKK